MLCKVTKSIPGCQMRKNKSEEWENNYQKETEKKICLELCWSREDIIICVSASDLFVDFVRKCCGECEKDGMCKMLIDKVVRGVW